MKQTLYLFFFFYTLSNAQHTAEFDKIASKIKLTETIAIDAKFKNGNQKIKGHNNIYEFGDYIYERPTGKRNEYYKSGKIMIEAEYDAYGYILNCKSFDGNGNLLHELKTLKVHTTANTAKQFLNSTKHLEILTEEKIYKCSSDFYLQSEGQRLNNKKIGTWKKYFDNGELKKEKEY